MPRDNADTALNIIVLRHKGGTKDRLNMDLALLENQTVTDGVSASSSAATASVGNIVNPGGGGGGASGGGRTCFSGETLLGSVRIDTIKIGDTVIAFNPETKQVGKCQVLATFIHEVLEILRVELENGKVLNVTPEHLVYNGDGFSPIGNFTDQNLLYDENFRAVRIVNIYKMQLDKPMLVYNIETEWQTYFANFIAVHNLKNPNDP